MAAQIDIRKNSKIRRSKNGYRVDRSALVSGVTGNIDELLSNAINDAQLPDYLDEHPTISGIYLQQIEATPLGGGKYLVTMSYYNEPGDQVGATSATIRASSNTVAEETKFDIYGNRMETQYAIISGLRYSPFTAEVERPMQQLDLDWIETTYPRALMDTFQGRINSGDWYGFAPQTLLCYQIQAEENGDGQYSVRMSLQYNPKTWKFVSRTIDAPFGITGPHTTPDPDLDLTTGKKEFDVYEAVDFSLLGVTIPGAFMTLSGSLFGGIDEADIVAGGETIIIDLDGETWVAAGTTFDAVRQDILDGLVSNKNEAGGWNAMAFDVTDVVRTSATRVTITLSSESGYQITETEDISVTVPASALDGSSYDFFNAKRARITTT